MVRNPCCEKIGLKKGPWTQGEDAILVSYIQRYGHGNWRALPRQAELLRCGKSCRLRWTNYLRPGIKRGNFTKEEEDMIISLHEMLGNRWSAIAARLAGRTDNEIKNVWHTHLKKRLEPTDLIEGPKKRKVRTEPKAKTETGSEPTKPKPNPVGFERNPRIMSSNSSPIPPMSDESNDISSVSPCMSRSDSAFTIDANDMSNVTQDSTDFLSLEFSEIDECFWNEALSMENCTAASIESTLARGETLSYTSEQLSLESLSNNDDVNFWLRFCGC